MKELLLSPSAMVAPQMVKHFNTAGPQIAALHYSIDPLARINLAEIEHLVAQQRYFVLHAPRQTGKTTCLFALRDHFNAGHRVRAVYANIESAQAARNDIASAAQAILSVLAQQVEGTLGIDALELNRQKLLDRGANAAFGSALRLLAQSSDRPVLVLLDEVDSLVGDTLISLLRQLRAGYGDRPNDFPVSIILCGVRDVRDYRMTMGDGEVITGGSAFNIKAKSLRLGDFSRAEMEALYAQHTTATGQLFTLDALNLAWESTRGQPWLVNALAEECTVEQIEGRDFARPIDLVLMRKAREALILRNDSHLDQLMDKLREPRVRAVIAPMLEGKVLSPVEADRQYLLDLGLIRHDASGLAPANGIYAEVMPRVLTGATQSQIHIEQIASSWKNASGKLDPQQFLRNFFDFWRVQGEPMMATAPYHEVAPTLVLMAYLQRVINGAGRIEREYAAGSGRLDLWVVHGDVCMAIEVKVWRDGRPDPQIEGLLQIERYLQRLNLAEGFLVIFDQRTKAPKWEKRMSSSNTVTASGRAIWVMRG